MSADWIKVEKTTPGKPEVLGISQILGVHPAHAFGLCVRFWLWCDDQLDRESVTGMSQKFVTNVTLDYVIGHTGFADALVQVGWLKTDGGRLVVPNFDRHLSESAKKRADSRRRKQKQRDGESESVTGMSQEFVTNEGQNEDKCPTASLSISQRENRASSCADSEAFERFWKEYPCAQGKKPAKKAFDSAIARLKKKSTEAEAVEKLVQAAKDYARYMSDCPSPPKVKYAQGWLNDERYEDDYVEELERARRSAPPIKTFAQQRQENTKKAFEEVFGNDTTSDSAEPAGFIRDVRQ